MHQATKSRHRAAHSQIVVRGVEHYMDAKQMVAATLDCHICCKFSSH